MEGLVCKLKGFLLRTFKIPKESLLMQKESVVEEKRDQQPQV